MLFEHMPMGIAVLDRAYCIQRYNPTWDDFSARYAPSSAAPLAPGVCYFDHLRGTEATVQPMFERVLAGETIQQNDVRYLLKNVTADELANAIRAAHAGQPTLAPEATAALIHAATRTVLSKLG